LRAPPESIEAYDISTIQGTNSVGAKVRFENGLPAKSGYRRFRIKTVRGQDDFAMMGEVVSRRLGHIDDDPLPDIMLIDGGKGQLAAALGALERAGLQGGAAREEGGGKPDAVRIALAALAKREEEVFVSGRGSAPADSARLEGAAALAARKGRGSPLCRGVSPQAPAKGQTGSALDKVEGLGAKKAAALLRRFSSVAGIRAASEDELCQVEGIGPVLARKIRETLG